MKSGGLREEIHQGGILDLLLKEVLAYLTGWIGVWGHGKDSEYHSLRQMQLVEHHENRILCWRNCLYLSMFQVHILIEVTVLKKKWH